MVETEVLHFFEGRMVPGNKNYQDNTVNIKKKIFKRLKQSHQANIKTEWVTKASHIMITSHESLLLNIIVTQCTSNMSIKCLPEILP